MRRILITGGRGYIATSLYESLKDNFNVELVTRQSFNLVNTADTLKWFEDKEYDVVIHTAIIGGRRVIEDKSSQLDKNLLMYYNLLQNRDKFKRFISFGSGAERDVSSYYGLSKRVIADSMLEKDNFYNIRLYGLFDKNELPNRFIKQNLNRYISKKSIIIYKDKKMDFFYMEDFINLVKLYVTEKNLPKQIDCTYSYSYKLSEIGDIINSISDYKVPIKIEQAGEESPYVGIPNTLLPFRGLKYGVSQVYNDLKYV